MMVGEGSDDVMARIIEGEAGRKYVLTPDESQRLMSVMDEMKPVHIDQSARLVTPDELRGRADAARNHGNDDARR